MLPRKPGLLQTLKEGEASKPGVSLSTFAQPPATRRESFRLSLEGMSKFCNIADRLVGRGMPRPYNSHTLNFDTHPRVE